MTGLTSAGFKIERLQEVKAKAENRLRETFGDVDLRAESVFGQFTGISSETDALLWQLAEDVYLSQYPDTASGLSLDQVCALTGVARAPARPTQINAVAYGLENTILSEGREVENRRTGDVYRSSMAMQITRADALSAFLELTSVSEGDYTVTIRGISYTYTAGSGDSEQQVLTGISNALNGAGVARVIEVGRLILTDDVPMAIGATPNIAFVELGVSVPFAAIETGPLTLAPDDLTQIKTPIAGWARVSNLEPGVTGSNRETDGELRARREKSIQITATNTLDAIFSRLGQVQFVTDVNALENNSPVVDSFGTDPNSVWAIVEGGSDEDISRVLFDVVSAGIGRRGAVTVNVVSQVSGKTYQVSFDRPTYIDPMIEVQYTALPNFPAEGEELMRKALVARTFALGEKLIIPRLYSPVNTVEGVEIEAIQIDGGAANIVAAPNEKIRIIGSNITFTETA